MQETIGGPLTVVVLLFSFKTKLKRVPSKEDTPISKSVSAFPLGR